MNIGDDCTLYDQEIKFVLGFAGTGKSTLLVKRVEAVDKELSVVITPTHKAKEVLINKGINAITIHSLLNLVPNINENFRGKMKSKLHKLGDIDIKDLRFIFVDEFSMVPTFVLDILLESLNPEATVTLFGDIFQLPPVSGNKIRPYDYSTDITILDKQYRSKAPNIIETYTRYVRYLANNDPDNEYFDMPECNDLKLNYGGEDLIKNYDNWLPLYNPDTDYILSYRNKKVKELNNKVAKYLLGTTKLVKGEQLLAGNYLVEFIEQRDVNFKSEFIYPQVIKGSNLAEDYKNKIRDLKNQIIKYKTDLSMYKTCFISSKDFPEGVYIYYDENYLETEKRLKKEVEKAQNDVIEEFKLDKKVKVAAFCREHNTHPLVKARGKAWSNYLKFNNFVFRLDRTYARTVHKSQGSEFRRVFINYDDVKFAIQDGYYLNFARLMYVGLSRAIEQVIIIK